ncbi:carboxypeptidase M32 [Methylocapsa sp. D3K7]|uniref:carboxypeptidase M32 n=1 Tax=Methylocapsa sp. D3K7 TaxID=3041435 RepID=UPI00244EC965|nr:carboxypeptidase M32 [Methylocapsa sp. D3K7]WGJ15402.1 carboxypeptidase M32 [Methylocapsa sp. D3K7]
MTKTAETKLAELKLRLLEISDLAGAGALLGWDQSTYMPRGGAPARARQGATLSKLAHEKSIDPALGKLLDELAPYADDLPYQSDEASLIRVARRDFEKAIKVPSAYVARASALGSSSYDAWTRARPANDFATMRPFLEQAVELSREYAGFFAPYQHVADPLIDAAEEGMTTASIRSLFAELRSELQPIVRAIAEQPVPSDGCLRGSFPETTQLDYSLLVVKQFGYDLDRGRLDKTHHPFCTKFSTGDVRITTRVDEKLFGDALFSTMHESGHALYEQGVATALDGTPLGSGTSVGVHESQSRLWENVVGRGRAFWEHFFPILQDRFPDQFRRTSFETFYRAINKVQRSLIRTDADEVTYNLHIMMRFDLELDLLEGSLRVKDLPEAWRARMRTDLGVTPDGDRDGCLQDVHWYAGSVGGGFQSYTIGNILSAQFYAAALNACPGIPAEIAKGKFGTLHGWLRKHLYEHGRKFQPGEVVMQATGGPMSIEPYLAYLRTKYGELYHLPPTGEGNRRASTGGR